MGINVKTASKIIAIVLLAALPLLGGIENAAAQTASQQPKNAGKCPDGTCGKSGGQWAKDTRNCSASYCKKK